MHKYPKRVSLSPFSIGGKNISFGGENLFPAWETIFPSYGNFCCIYSKFDLKTCIKMQNTFC